MPADPIINLGIPIVHAYLSARAQAAQEQQAQAQQAQAAQLFAFHQQQAALNQQNEQKRLGMTRDYQNAQIADRNIDNQRQADAVAYGKQQESAAQAEYTSQAMPMLSQGLAAGQEGDPFGAMERIHNFAHAPSHVQSQMLGQMRATQTQDKMEAFRAKMLENALTQVEKAPLADVNKAEARAQIYARWGAKGSLGSDPFGDNPHGAGRVDAMGQVTPEEIAQHIQTANDPTADPVMRSVSRATLAKLRVPEGYGMDPRQSPRNNPAYMDQRATLDEAKKSYSIARQMYQDERKRLLPLDFPGAEAKLSPDDREHLNTLRTIRDDAARDYSHAAAPRVGTASAPQPQPKGAVPTAHSAESASDGSDIPDDALMEAARRLPQGSDEDIATLARDLAMHRTQGATP